MGPNIYGFYYTPKNLCATFCTAYDVKGKAALSSQSGGIGMAIIGFSRSAKMGVSAIVGLGNKSDIDEDDLLDLLRAGRQHPDHRPALRGPEGRPRLRRSRQAGLEEEAGRRAEGRPHLAGAKAASSHTGALAGNDKIYEDVLKQSGVIRARSLRAAARVRARRADPADPEGRERRSSSRAPAARACCCRTPASTTGCS